jgi:two-component system, NtrC family, nitrogen regulation sensor histidine kinase NtrY
VISRFLYINIIIRVLLIVLIAMVLGYSVFYVRSLRLAIICLFVIIAFTFNLIYYLNNTNTRIKFFFDSVRNDDSSLSFPVNSKNPYLDRLYESMNRVNQQIRMLKIENRQQEQFFQILIEHLATGIITYDIEGFVNHANSSAKRLLSVDVLTHIKQIERVDQKLYIAISGIKPFERKLVAIKSSSGEIQLSLKSTSLKTGEKELFILSIQDIKNELDEKELDSWMKLIRVLMHEIMNSITPITSLSESLSDFYSKDGKPVPPAQITSNTIEKTVQGLTVIKEQGHGLMSFVESYRKLTRVPEPEKKLFKISDLLKRATTLFNSLEGSEKLELLLSLEDPELEVFADQNMISLVLINLLKNAIEANSGKPDGRIEISAGRNSEKHVEICVADNGPGIPDENLDKIFVPFFTTRKDGSGIGLSISKQIMKVHGGNLKVKTGKETVFCLSFQD